MTVYVRAARAADAHYLAKHMRPEDAAEVRAAGGLTPLDALLGGIEVSDYAHVLVAKDRPDEALCMWGVRPTPDPRVGMIWLLCGVGLYEHSSGFLRESRNVFKQFAQQYECLWNFVDERNAAHVRFLQWNGCTFINRIENHGHEKRPFLEFVRLSCVTP